MEPNIWKGDKLAICRINKQSELNRGDVVFFRDNRYSTCHIKRVLGLPGERVEVKKGQILINDQHFNGVAEIKRDFFSNMRMHFILSGEYFLMGDDMNMSIKSKQDGGFFDPVPFKNIIGKVTGIYWPPEHAKYLL